MDARGNVLARHEGVRTTPGFEKTMAQAQETVARIEGLSDQARSGDQSAALELLELQVELGHVSGDPAWERLATLRSVPEGRRKALEQLLIKRQVESIQSTATADPETHIAIGRRFAVMLAQKRVPKDSDSMYFWFFTGSYARSEKNADLFERCIEGLRFHKKQLGSNLQKMEEELEKLRESK